MFWRLALIALAGCGRIGFDVASQPGTDSGPIGHDEDGDGVPDSIDVCPYLAGPQDDGDGDGVGDACDPNPMVARDHIARFATMAPGDQPLTLNNVGPSTWSQGSDGVFLDGDVATDWYGGGTLPLVAGDVRVAAVVDIREVGGAAFQHQFAMQTSTVAPLYLTEINERLGSYSNAEITLFDGSNYFMADSRALATGIHTGTILMTSTQRLDTSTMLDVSWPGEPYQAVVNDTVYQGSQQLQINVNNLRIEIRSLCVITSS